MTYLLRLMLPLLIYSVSNAQELELVNSTYDEQNPVLSPDMQTLYFTRSNHPQNVDGARDAGDIWYSERLSNGSWGPPQHAGANINSRGWNGLLGFNSDGTIMFLHDHYSSRGNPKTQGVSFSKKIGKQWAEPQNIHIAYFKNIAGQQTGWISPDEDVILLSIESYSTLGAEDIYVILKSEEGEWKQPVNLGSKINTRFQELSPAYNPQDSTLYFSSNGHGGVGSSDIFKTKKLDETWRSWSDPILLGDSVNSSGRELGFSNFPNHNFAVFSSTLNSDGYGDLKIHRYGELPPEDAAEKRIFVVNSRTGEFISGEIQLTDEENRINILQVTASGVSISDYAPGMYRASISSPGFLSVNEQLEINQETDQYTFALQPLEKGTRMVLENVLFEQSKDVLLPESYEQLNQVVRLMKENPVLKIRLEGHTDARGSAKANLRLSKLRVKAVEDYLISKGINKRRIDGKGFGGEQPLYPNDSEENRMKNRRVEFVIVD